MAQLTLRNARTSIERGIVMALSNAYKVRQPVVADAPTLRKLASVAIPANTYRFITSLGVCFRWSRFSTATDDGVNAIKPNDLASSKPGRWLNTGSTVTSGYLMQVEAYNGQQSIEDTCERLLGQTPAVLVVWNKGHHTLESWNHSALWYYDCDFTLLVFGSSLRDAFETEEGSEVPTELQKDPGINAVMGDIKTIVAGSAYGLDGVAYTDLGDETRIEEDQASRTALESLQITVRATLWNPDTDLVDFDSATVQEQLVDTPLTPASGIDMNNYVLSGCTIPLNVGLTVTPDAGSAQVGGTLVSVTQTPRTFSPNVHTYRDLDLSGAYHYTSGPYYFTPPDPVTGYLRVGVSVTDANGVVFDRILADSLINYGDPYNVSQS